MKSNKYYKFIPVSIIAIIGFVTMSVMVNVDKQSEPTSSLYDLKIKSLTDEDIDLSEFKGKKILFVNVASKCGFTPQYEGLQKLHDKYSDKLVIIGVPCNQFMNQEPGTSEEIVSFCQKNYGVSFLMTEKIDVKGKNIHPIYEWLTTKKMNGNIDSSVKWNFQKYLIDENGHLLDIFSSKIKPGSEEIIRAINS